MTATPRMDEGTTASGRRADREPVRVLVVDPCPDAADSLALLLSVYGCAAAVAYSGGDAVDLARRFTPDLILADLALPDVDGRDLPRRLGGTGYPFLVAVDDLAGEDDRRLSEQAGFGRHLLKPVSPDDLLDVFAAAKFRRAAVSAG